MKKAIFTFLTFTLCLFFSCEKRNLFNPKPPDELPPATMTGENTFGCLVNGEVWRPYSESIWDRAIYAKHDLGWVGCDQLLVSGNRRLSSNADLNGVLNQSVSVNVWCPKLGNNDFTGDFLYFQPCGFIYWMDTLSTHIMNITKLDTVNHIASGTFEFTAISNDCQDTVRITEGRFDVDSSL